MKKSLKQIISFVIVFFMITSMTFGTYSIGEGTNGGNESSGSESSSGGDESSGSESSSDGGNESSGSESSSGGGNESSGSESSSGGGNESSGSESSSGGGNESSGSESSSGGDEDAGEGENTVKPEEKPDTEKPEEKPEEKPDTEKPEEKPEEKPDAEKPEEEVPIQGPAEKPEEEAPIQGPAEKPEEEAPIQGPAENPEEGIEEDLEAELEEEEPEEIIEYTDLTVVHILVEEYGDEIGMTETIEDLEVGSSIYVDDYVFNHEDVNFIGSDSGDFELGIEGNFLELYYEPVNDYDDLAEAPDYTSGDNVYSGSSDIKEFRSGELGPFDKTDYSILRNSKVVNKEFYSDEVNNKNWPEAGSLNLNKTGEVMELNGKGNQWEISLDIEARDLKKTTDIVLVVDRSGSMNGNKMQNAQRAAKSFVENLLVDENSDNVRIAIVSFAGDVSIDSELYGYEDKDEIIRAINSIRPSGGTHIQAGIRQGNALLEGSTADYKTMVVLGDGAATYSYELKHPADEMEHWFTSGTGKWFNPHRDHYRTKIDMRESSFDYGQTIGNGNNENYVYHFDKDGRYYYRHGSSVIAEANLARSKGCEIFSISLGAGEEGEWTLKNLADSENYFSTHDANALEPIFSEIADRVIFAANNASIEDMIDPMYYIPGINAENYEDLIKVSHGDISFDLNKNKITWNIGAVNQNEEYWMKYTLALDYSAEPGKLYPTNEPVVGKSVYIDYDNIDDNSARKYFSIPEFKLRGLTLGNKVLSGERDKEFDIILEGPSGKNSKTWIVSLRDGEQKSIKGLLPGSYSVTEIVPMNYRLNNISGGRIKSSNGYIINIGENDWDLSATITNKRNNGGWFFNENTVENRFARMNKNKIISSILDAILPGERKDRKKP